MKYIRKKVIKGIPYHYFEYMVKKGNHSLHITKYIGRELPLNLRTKLQEYFQEIEAFLVRETPVEAKRYFPPETTRSIEKYRTQYLCLQHELFTAEKNLFKTLFTILFVLNSNRAEGSRVTREDIEKIIKKKIKPRTSLDKEIVNSFDAINFAFSKKMKWSTSCIKKIHNILFSNLEPAIAGIYKKRNNIVGNSAGGALVTTTPWEDVPHAMGDLLRWFNTIRRKNIYPPILALEFHWRFEAIHPFLDGNGRVGRILLNAYLIEQGFMPVIYFSQNHAAYCDAIAKARDGKKMPLAKHFVESVKKTFNAVEEYKREGIIRGGSPAVKQWEIQKDRIRIY